MCMTFSKIDENVLIYIHLSSTLAKLGGSSCHKSSMIIKKLKTFFTILIFKECKES